MEEGRKVSRTEYPLRVGICGKEGSAACVSLDSGCKKERLCSCIVFKFDVIRGIELLCQGVSKL